MYWQYSTVEGYETYKLYSCKLQPNGYETNDSGVICRTLWQFETSSLSWWPNAVEHHVNYILCYWAENLLGIDLYQQLLNNFPQKSFLIYIVVFA